MKGRNSMKAIVLASGIFMATMSLGQNLKEAIQLTTDEQFEKADKAFKNLINAKPDNGENYFYEGENFYAWGKLDSAQAAYEKGIKMSPTSPLDYVGEGKIKLGQGQDPSDNFYKAKTISKSRDAIVLYKIGEAYTVAPVPYRDLKQAQDYLHQAILLDSKNPDIYIALGDALWLANLSNASDAITQYDKALSLNPKDVVAILREGTVYQSGQNWDLAKQKYLMANQTDSTFAPSYRQMAELYHASGKDDDAVVQYKKYLALNNAMSARIRYAKFLYVDKKYSDCITESQKILATDSSDVYLYRVLAYSQYETKDYKNGLLNITKFFNKAAATNTKTSSADYSYWGKLLSKNGQDSLAIQKLTQAATMSLSSGNTGDASDLYNQMGTMLYLDKNYAGSIPYFKKRVQLSPSDVNAYYYMGKAAYNCKKYQTADSAFSSVISQRSDLLIGYEWKSYVEEAIDSNCESGFAIPACNQYIQKVGSDTVKNSGGLVTAFQYLGLCAYSKKDVEGAKAWFRRIQGLDPNNAPAKQFFDRLKQPQRAGGK